jgi:hypothetical protein
MICADCARMAPPPPPSAPPRNRFAAIQVDFVAFIA